MLTYVTKRLGSLCLSLIVASLVIFACIEIVPGDPASFMLGINAQPDTIQALRVELGLDQSLASTVSWLGWWAPWWRHGHVLHLPYTGV